MIRRCRHLKPFYGLLLGKDNKKFLSIIMYASAGWKVLHTFEKIEKNYHHLIFINSTLPKFINEP